MHASSEPLQSAIAPKTMAKLLLIDHREERAAQTLADLSICRFDFQVLCATDAASLRGALEQFGPELVIAEFDLPTLPGLEGLRIARAWDPAVPFLFHSEQLDDAAAFNAVRSGASDCIARSTPLRLVTASEAALAVAQARRLLTRVEHELIYAQRYRSLSLLLGALAHDLRNVLQPLRLASAVLKRSLDPTVSKLHGTLENAADRGLDVVSSMVAYCKGRDDRLQDLDIQEMFRSLRLMLPQKVSRSTEIRYESRLTVMPCRVRQTELEQCLLNLCLNAIAAMPDGGRLCIRAEQASCEDGFFSAAENAAPGPYLRLTVQDDGRGISDEVLRRISQPMSAVAGSGLGLRFCHMIVAEHRGVLRIRSQPGHGTCVEIYMPLRAETAPASAIRRILFAVADPMLTDAFATLCVAAGFELIAVADSAASEAYLRQQNMPDAAIIDTDLPRLEGARVYSLLRRHRYAGPSLLLASPGADMADIAASPGVSVLTKPVDGVRLMAVLRASASAGPRVQPPC